MQIFDEIPTIESIDKYEGKWSIHRITNYLTYVESKIDTTKQYKAHVGIRECFALVYGENNYRVKNYVSLE
jgi:hypothetical protein